MTNDYEAAKLFLNDLLKPDWSMRERQEASRGVMLHLDRLHAENERAIEGLQALQEATGSHNDHNPWLGVTAAAILLKDDNERLRAALQQIASAVFYTKKNSLEAKNLQDMASAALGSDKARDIYQT